EVSRPRRDRPVGAATEVEPPEELSAREGGIARLPRLPDVLARDEAVRLLPEQDLGEVAVEPAVGDDPVAARRKARQVSRLHRARSNASRRTSWPTTGSRTCSAERKRPASSPGKSRRLSGRKRAASRSTRPRSRARSAATSNARGPSRTPC